MGRDTIIQIMPADGWCQIQLWSEEPYYLIEPLVGWALVKEVGEDYEDMLVAGLIARDWVELADEEWTANTTHYVYIRESDIDDDMKAIWSEEGKKWAEEYRNRK